VNQLGHFLKFPGSSRLLGGCGPADMLSVLPDCKYVGAAAAMKEGLRMSREGDAA